MAIFTEKAADSAGSFIFYPGRDWPKVAHQSEEGHKTQYVVGYIDFAPEEALAGGAGKKVMVVVPTFSKSEKSEPKVILAFVFRIIPSSSE
jgi:hypothetical protein